MNRSFALSVFACFIASISLSPVCAQQQYDTLVNVGNHRLHFHVIKGNGVPILFDAGGGNDGSIWNNLLEPIAKVTGATIITYDRAGFGKSELDTSFHGIENGVKSLSIGLHKLGFSGSIMYVAHSFGGFYATAFAAQHPDRVKAAVLIDINTSCFLTDARIPKNPGSDSATQTLKTSKPGIYYMAKDMWQDQQFMRQQVFPVTIPVTDIVPERSVQQDSVSAADWDRCHQDFVKAAPNRKRIFAYACGHYVFMDNPQLVINAIVEQYAPLLPQAARDAVMSRTLSYSIESVNEMQRKAAANQFSESSINSWGYNLVRQHKMDEALEVFKLNVTLHPQSGNTFDSLGEIYELLNNKEEAIKNYKRSLELDPKNNNAADHLKKLMQ